MSEARRGMLFMAGFAGAWAITEALEILLLARYSLYQVTWVRFLVQSVMVLAICGVSRQGVPWHTPRPLLQLARAAAMLALTVAGARSLQYQVSPAAILLGLWAFPALLLLMTASMPGERAGVAGWSAVVAGYCAVLLAIQPTASDLAASVYPIVMGVTLAAYVAMTKSLRRNPARVNLFVVALGVWVPLTPVVSQVWVAPTVTDLVVMLAIGLVGSVALYCLERVARGPTCAAAPFAYLQVPFSIGIGWATRAETPTAGLLAGTALIVGVTTWTWSRWNAGPEQNVERAA